jgi:hypothetical protein
MKKIITLLFLMAFGITSMSGQAVGDYGTANPTGTWTTTASDWVVCVSAGTWTGATAAPAPPSSTNLKNVFIRAGHTMDVGTTATASSLNFVCLNLTIEATANLNIPTATSGNNSLSPRGILTLNGTLTCQTENSALNRLHSQASNPFSITGSGTFVKPNVQFDSDITISSTSTVTFSGRANFNGPSPRKLIVEGILNVESTGSSGFFIPTSMSVDGGTSGTINLKTTTAITTLTHSGTFTIKTLTMAIPSTFACTLSGSSGTHTITDLTISGTGTGSATLGAVSGTSPFPRTTMNITNLTTTNTRNVTITGAATITNLTMNKTSPYGVLINNDVSSVTGTLTLTSGVFDLNATNKIFTIGNGATISRAAAGSFANAALLAFGTTVNVIYTGSAATTSGVEIPTSSTVLNNLTINNIGGVTLSSSPTVNGTLALTAGTLAGGSNNVTVVGNVTGTGTFTGTGKIVMSGNTIASNISGATISNLELNDADGFALTGAPTITGVLTLTTGNTTLNALDLTVTGSISGGSSTSSIVTNSSGKLIMLASSGGTLFPIGTSTTSYDPVTIGPASPVTFTVGVSASLTPAVNVTANVVSRIWNLTATGAGNTNLSFTPAASTLTASNTPGIAVYGHYSSSWRENTASYSAGTWSVTHPASAGFSPFGVGVRTAFAITLPIELTNFQAKANQKSALLTWTTASEKDNALFNIEQSTNGTDFQTIGEVKGQGTTAASTHYSFEHATPSVGVNYYRLKQVDINGEATYSAVRTVVFGKTGLIVKPTLVQEAVNVVVSDDVATTISIFNMSGQQVLTAKAQGEQRIDVSTLPIGLYMIRTATGDVARFMKQ